MIGELKRKGVHLLSLVVPLGYIYLSKSIVAPIVGLTVLVAMIFDIVRIRRKRFRAWVRLYFGDIFRRHEEQNLSGALYILTGFLLSILLFNKGVAITVMVCVIVGDTMAAIFGKRYGKIEILEGKTIAGTLAFLLSSLLSLTILSIPALKSNLQFLTHLWQLNLIAATIATLLEVLPIPLDDNLRITLITGAILQFVFMA